MKLKKFKLHTGKDRKRVKRTWKDDRRKEMRNEKKNERNRIEE